MNTIRKKVFHQQDNIGKAKHTVSFHDGVKTHPDGSPFYDIEIFSSKKKRREFVKSLESQGYQERITISLNRFDVFDQ